MSSRVRPVVLKFGGASLADPNGILHDVRALRKTGTPLVLVVSAREGVTDLLSEGLAHPRAKKRHREILEQVRRAHPGLPTRVAGSSTDCAACSPSWRRPPMSIRRCRTGS